MSKQSIIAPIVLVGSAVLFFAAVWSLNHFYLGKMGVPAEVIYGEPLPEGLKLLASFKTDEGITADIYTEKEHTKVGFAFSSAKPADPQAVSGTELIKALITSSSKRTIDPRLTPFTQRYIAAQFDPLRAYDQEPVTMKVAGQEIEAVRFLTTSEWNHLLGILNLPNGQFVFKAVRKNAKVDPDASIPILEKEIGASGKW